MRHSEPCLHCGGEIPESRRVDAAYCSNTCGGRNRNRRYAARHPDRVRENRYRQNSKTSRRITSRIKSRAKRMGIPFDLRPEDLDIPDTCPVLGIELRESTGSRGYHPHAISVDRIDPTRGYVRGNVRVISARANLLKNDATVAELEAVLADLKGLQ